MVRFLALLDQMHAEVGPQILIGFGWIISFVSKRSALLIQNVCDYKPLFSDGLWKWCKLSFISAPAVQSNAVSSTFVTPVCAPFCKLYVATVYSPCFSKIIFN